MKRPIQSSPFVAEISPRLRCSEPQNLNRESLLVAILCTVDKFDFCSHFLELSYSDRRMFLAEIHSGFRQRNVLEPILQRIELCSVASARIFG